MFGIFDYVAINANLLSHNGCVPVITNVSGNLISCHCCKFLRIKYDCNFGFSVHFLWFLNAGETAPARVNNYQA